MEDRNLNITVCEAVVDGPRHLQSMCVTKHTVRARKSNDDERGDYIFTSPWNGNQAYAFETYEDMLNSDCRCTYWVPPQDENDQ